MDRYGPDQVLVGSFTRAAARELVSRDLPVPDENVGTLHALAWRALGRPLIAETKAKEWNRDHGILRISGRNDRTMDDMDEPGSDAEGDALLSKVNTYRARRLPVEQWPDQNAVAFWKTWSAWKYENGYWDFTDLIEKCLVFHPGPPQGARVGFFDEVQDFTPLELTLVRKWGEYMDYVVLTGDDDQNLYFFKGAVPESFLYPELPEDQVRVLHTSYRLPRAVHAYADRWIRQVRLRQPKDWHGRDEEGLVEHLPLSYRDTDTLCDALRGPSDAGRSVMVLASCSYMLQGVVRELRARGELFHNPWKRNRADWNPLQQPKEGQRATWRAVDAYFRPLQTVGTVSEWQHLFKRAVMGDVTPLAAWPDDTPVRPGDDLAGVVFKEPHRALCGDVEYLRQHVLASKRQAIEYPVQAVMHNGSLAEQPRIIVGTIHSVKGAGADDVYLLPDISHAAAQQADTDPDPLTRLMYVGMTRTKQRLVLCEASGREAIEWL